MYGRRSIEALVLFLAGLPVVAIGAALTWSGVSAMVTGDAGGMSMQGQPVTELSQLLIVVVVGLAILCLGVWLWSAPLIYSSLYEEGDGVLMFRSVKRFPVGPSSVAGRTGFSLAMAAMMVGGGAMASQQADAADLVADVVVAFVIILTMSSVGHPARWLSMLRSRQDAVDPTALPPAREVNRRASSDRS